jgi:hypothetical protein
MASSDPELKQEVQDLAGYVSDTVLTRAKRHIRTEKGITDSNFDWYASIYREEALFWWSCLFAKVATGELDAQNVQVGAIDVDSLLANDKGEVTTWFRQASQALQNIDTGGDYNYGFGISSPTRDDRVYGGDDDGTGDTADEGLL